ncbi:MAG: adenylate/guanylate cyclase domain-containing protein [bacterium]
MTRPTRKLTTILAADVVGFSKLMDQHEELTLKNLKTCRDIVDPIITEYGGRIFHTAGDSVIAEFASPVSSVEAAIEFQQILEDRNKNVPEESQITFRVGIHLDDVIIEGDNIYGNGVNVAARLESICEPGCILVSRFVQEKIEKRIQLTINSLGKSELKNIEGEFSIFQINPAKDGETASPPAASPVPAEKEAPPTPEVKNTKPRLLVLPFRNLNNDEENEYLVDGIVEDIITEFSMINSIEIISRHTAFNFKGKEINSQQVTSELGVNYIATGSIRSAGSRIRISVELTDAATESALWSERFDRMMEDVFEIQDEIVRKVIVALVGQLEIASLARAKRKPTENLSSYEFLLRGKENHHKFSKEGVVEGLQMFDKSIDADPENAQAYAWKVCTLGQGMFAGYLEEPVEDLFEEAQKTLQKALDINPNDFECHRMFCEIYKSFEDFEKAELHGRKAYEMNPNDPRIVNGFGEYLLLTGDTEKGVELMIKAYELDPNGKGDSNSNKRLGDIVFACYVHGEYEKSLEYAEKIEKLTTNAWLAKIASLSALGKADDKEKEMNKFLESNADFSMEDHISKFHFQDKSVNETMIQLLN